MRAQVDPGVISEASKSCGSISGADCTSMTVISFAHIEPFLRSEPLRQRLSSRYRIPNCFWSEACQRSNGFFGCSDAFDNKMKLQRHSKVP